MSDIVTLKGCIVHGGYGYEITETGDIRMRVNARDIQKGDLIESTSIEFGVLHSAIIIRPFTNVKVTPICLAAEA